MKIYCLTISLFLSISLFGQSKIEISANALYTGPLTGLHTEIGIGVSLSKNLSANLRAGYNFSQATQFSIDVLCKLLNYKRLNILTGLEYTYSTYIATAYDGYLIPDRKMDGVYYGFCGNSIITTEHEYGQFGTVAFPVHTEFQLFKKVGIFSNYSYMLNDKDKVRIGLKYQFGEH